MEWTGSVLEFCWKRTFARAVMLVNDFWQNKNRNNCQPDNDRMTSRVWRIQFHRWRDKCSLFPSVWLRRRDWVSNLSRPFLFLRSVWFRVGWRYFWNFCNCSFSALRLWLVDWPIFLVLFEKNNAKFCFSLNWVILPV